MKKLSVIIVLLSLISFVSCEKASITGSGSIISQVRNTGAFTGFRSYGDINVHVTYGNILSVEVKGYANLVAITVTEVKNGLLEIKYDNKYNRINNSNMEVYITSPVLLTINTYGSGDVWINGFQNGDHLSSSINGSGDQYISNSNYNTSSFDIFGSGNIRAQGLQTINTTATIHGSGDVDISCSAMLRARINGSGDIGYWGNPGLDVVISGSGRIQKKG